MAIARTHHSLKAIHKAFTRSPEGYPERGPHLVPADKADPSVSFPGYRPKEYVAPIVLSSVFGIGKPASKSWADEPDPRAALARRGRFTSFLGPVRLDDRGRPVNPVSRTGVTNRGLLGKWGANFAADPIITRVDPRTGRLQMAAIERRDSGQWAIPGGMVDDGELPFAALQRELREETGVSLTIPEDRMHVLYQGYVDDWRNTDNAWMESTVAHYHLTPDEAAQIEFKKVEEDDTEVRRIQWMDVSDDNLANLYASHGDFVRWMLEDMKSSGFES